MSNTLFEIVREKPTRHQHRGWYVGSKIWKPTRDRALEVVQHGCDIAIALVPLEEWINGDLPKDLIDGIDLGFAHARAHDIKYILRFRYTTDSDMAKFPDAPLDQILRHAEQLKPVIAKNIDRVLTWQAGFFGAWGEWHYTAHEENKDPKNRAMLLSSLLDTHPDLVVSVRTPMQIHECARWMDPAQVYRLGVHNDCFLSSETNASTYDRPVEWWKARCEDLPLYGGETCRESEYTQDVHFAWSEMRRLNVKYLNKMYRQEVLADWGTKGVLPIFEQMMREAE